MKRFVITILLAGNLMSVQAVHAQTVSSKEHVSISEETKKVCNDVIRKIFDEIMAVKGQYENLKDFGEEQLTINEFGLGQIVYRYEIDKDQPEE